MTKPLLQGKIGYWVDGVLVHKPQRNTMGNTTEAHKNEADHSIRNKDWRQCLTQKRLKRRAIKIKYCSAVEGYLESLKNASKIGDINKAIHTLQRLARNRNRQLNGRRRHKNKYIRNTLRSSITYIFFPDKEERSAIYYAAHAGHTRLVELYLALYLIYHAPLYSVSIKKCLSYRDWFQDIKVLSLFNNFTIVEYDTCVLNSLNMETKYVMTKRKVTIEDAIKFVRNLQKNLPDMSDSIYSRLHSVSKKIKIHRERREKKKKPILHYDSCYDDLLCDEIDLNDDDSFASADDEDSVDNDITNAHSDFSMIGYNDAISTVDGDFSVQDYSVIEYDELQLEKDNELLLDWDKLKLCEESSKTTKDGISIFTVDEEEIKALKYDVANWEGTKSISELDVKSEANLDETELKTRLVSHDTAPTTYREAALVKQQSLPTSTPFIEDHNDEQLMEDDDKNSDKSSNIDEQEYNFQYLKNDYVYDSGIDAELLRDQYKFGRGGKVSEMFRGNSRKDKHASGKKDTFDFSFKCKNSKKKKRSSLKKQTMHYNKIIQ